jgi:hypothetical protein
MNPGKGGNDGIRGSCASPRHPVADIPMHPCQSSAVSGTISIRWYGAITVGSVGWHMNPQDTSGFEHVLQV